MSYRLLLLVLAVFSQAAAYGAPNSKAEREIRNVIRNVDDQRIAAIVKQDVPALDRLLADDFTYTHQGGVTETKAEFLGAMKNGSGAFTSIKLSGVTMHIFRDTAVLTGRCDITASREGRNIAIPMHFTEVYERAGGRWRCLLWQSTRLPTPAHP